ncbi:sarcoplasmic calcium-binding protein-like [Lingula anatina]|uniref:Sarcoplasmic calcium-binding protein-like n=1 Tax=Lingula anatina TaxID=7574 RepID=A0A1S3INJ8_LINAN|nr:sarcoplasmic calcium-binding protein-like [Lingula anatina]|eukprot:XP_013399820.1 sarcoplasmic calcium-binding protein-like [Lingula anatina]
MTQVTLHKQGLDKQPLCLRKPIEYPQLTGSDHWKRKMRTIFRAFDVDGDGCLTEDDMEAVVRRTAEYMNLDDENTNILLNQRLTYLRDVSSKDSTGEIKGKLSEDEFVQNHLANINESKFRNIWFDMLSSRFQMMDTDGDGLVSSDEYAALFYSFNIPSEHSDKIFDIIDTDNDGFISKDDFVQALTEFWLSENPDNKYNECFGPLVDVTN